MESRSKNQMKLINEILKFSVGKNEAVSKDIINKYTLKKLINTVKSFDILGPVRAETTNIVPWNYFQHLNSVIKDIFLPKGYPDSVSSDYLEYQIWDTCQAFCSSISGTLTMRAIMQGIGVGSDAATPISAALTWIMKDGTGMVGSILFAWIKGSKLDSDCKKWRLFADVLNDVAMFIELYIPYAVNYSTYLLCLATAFKALVGTAGSSTRAALITHQAIKGNIADVSAKDGSQEIFTNLFAFIFGIFLLKNVTETDQVWTIMCTATLFHLIFNYKAVRCLKMNVFNAQRFILSLRTYLPTSSVPTIEQVNRIESVFLGFGTSDIQICGFRIIFGKNMRRVIKSENMSAYQLFTIVTLFQDKDYLILVDNVRKIIYVTFCQHSEQNYVLKAYFHAFLIGICISHLQVDRHLAVVGRSRKHSPIYRLKNVLHEFVPVHSNSSMDQHHDKLIITAYMACEDLIEKEFLEFSRAFKEQGWSAERHLINIDDWRADWKSNCGIKNEELVIKKSSYKKGPGTRHEKIPRQTTQSDYSNLVIA